VDRVLEFEVVTPSGHHLFANACQNEDLFWALRGGGPSTFGVVLGVTFEALPKLTIQSLVHCASQYGMVDDRVIGILLRGILPPVTSR
jgi:FAD/FMN-containing dehydrogenase